MSSRIGPAIAASVSLLVLAFVAVLVGYSISHPGTAGVSPANLVTYVAFLLAFSTVGALVSAKRPRNPIGWLLLGSALAYVVGGVGSSIDAAPAGPGLSPERVIQWAGAWVWGVGVGFAVVALLLFPEGKLPSPRWRPALWLGIAGMVAFVIGAGFGSPVIGDGPAPNPFAVGGQLGEALAGLQVAFPLVVLGAGPFAVASVVVRFRRSRGIERQQVKWLLYSAALAAIALLVQVPVALLLPPATATDVQNAIVTGSLVAVPLAIGVAVLRYRLYDIDVLIRRTAIYGATTVVLAVSFFAVVIVVEAVLSPFTRGNDLAVVASTLVSLALFGPLRRRIQDAVDRRFYRATYDAERTLEAFSARLRDKVDIRALEHELLGAVDDTVRPAHAGVWLRAGRNDSRTAGG